jgi:proteasome activator subunit 4
LQLVDHQDDLFSIIKQLTESTFTEVTYASTGKLIEKIIFNMTTVFPYEARLVNPDVWQSDGGSSRSSSLLRRELISHTDFKYNHHMYWGKTYRLADVKAEWHMPSTAGKP